MKPILFLIAIILCNFFTAMYAQTLPPTISVNVSGANITVGTTAVITANGTDLDNISGSNTPRYYPSWEGDPPTFKTTADKCSPNTTILR